MDIVKGSLSYVREIGEHRVGNIAGGNSIFFLLFEIFENSGNVTSVQRMANQAMLALQNLTVLT